MVIECLPRAVLQRAVTVTVLRPPQGTYDENGRWQDYDYEPFEIRATIQPVKPEELEHIDEGRRTKGAVKIFSIEELKTANVENQTQPDIVVWNGCEYQVEEIKDWFAAGGFFQTIAIKVGQ